MVVPPLFGWSAGDVVLSVKVLRHVATAFKEAEDNLDRVKEFLETHSQSKCVNSVKKKLAIIDPAYQDFEKHLSQHQLLGSSLTFRRTSHSLTVRRGGQTIVWAFKELDGRVNALRLAATGPLAEINNILLIQVFYDLDKLNDKIDDKYGSPIDAAQWAEQCRKLDSVAHELNKAIVVQTQAYAKLRNLDDTTSMLGEDSHRKMNALHSTITDVSIDIIHINKRIKTESACARASIKELRRKVALIHLGQEDILSRLANLTYFMVVSTVSNCVAIVAHVLFARVRNGSELRESETASSDKEHHKQRDARAAKQNESMDEHQASRTARDREPRRNGAETRCPQRHNRSGRQYYSDYDDDGESRLENIRHQDRRHTYSGSYTTPRGEHVDFGEAFYG